MSPSLPSIRAVDAPDETELVRAAMRGEGQASQRLFMRCAPDLTRWVSRVVMGNDDAQDIVQDTFVEAFVLLKQLKQPESFRAWLRSIALTQVRRRFRKQRLLRRIGLGSSEPPDFDAVISPSAPPQVAAELRQIAQLMRRLPPDEATALVLHRVEGYTLNEIAEVMELSLATVKRRLAAAEQSLSAHTEEDP